MLPVTDTTWQNAQHNRQDGSMYVVILLSRPTQRTILTYCCINLHIQLFLARFSRCFGRDSDTQIGDNR